MYFHLKFADYADLGPLFILTTGHYCFEERGLLAQVWKKGEAQVLPISAFQCEFATPFLRYKLILVEIYHHLLHKK